MFRYNSVNRLANSSLGIYSSFPAANALLWISEEGICDLFELSRRQKARCTPVVLAEITCHFDADGRSGRQLGLTRSPPPNAAALAGYGSAISPGSLDVRREFPTTSHRVWWYPALDPSGTLTSDPLHSRP